MPPYRVSAIITAFNGEEFLADAIESVLTQTRPVDEIVVVDDGSTDDTAAIAARYSSRGVRYVHQENRGPGGARNRGIAETTGEFVAFLDCDDIWMPNKIERQTDFLLAHPRVGLLTGQRWWWDVERGSLQLRLPHVPRSKKRFLRTLLISNLVGNPSMVLVRREVFRQAGVFEPELAWGQDWQLWIRMSRVTEIAYLDIPVIQYRWHSAGVSHRNRWQRLDALHAISLAGIRSHPEAWCRPGLYLRAKSKREKERAAYLESVGGSRAQRVRHAVWAMCLYPLEDFKRKAILLFQTFLGGLAYRRLRKLWPKPSEDRQPASRRRE